MENDKSFNQGLVTGIAVISTIAFIALLIYVLGGGSFGDGNGDGDNGKKTAKKFEQCIDSDKYDAKIQADQALGMQLGVSGTPATYINGYLISGALPYERISQVIDTLLAGEEPDFDFMKNRETGEIIKVEMPQITSDDHKKGAINGQITMMEFSDFECPFCARFFPTVEQVKANYANDVTIVYKHFPLSFHQMAKPAAVAAECANEQGKFWQMHDKLFELSTAQKLTNDEISNAAVEIGLK